jgi:hypothetical protein
VDPTPPGAVLTAVQGVRVEAAIDGLRVVGRPRAAGTVGGRGAGIGSSCPGVGARLSIIEKYRYYML